MTLYNDAIEARNLPFWGDRFSKLREWSRKRLSGCSLTEKPSRPAMVFPDPPNILHLALTTTFLALVLPSSPDVALVEIALLLRARVHMKDFKSTVIERIDLLLQCLEVLLPLIGSELRLISAFWVLSPIVDSE